MLYNSIMEQGYQDPKQAKNYEDFLETEDGQIQKQVTLKAVFGRLPKDPDVEILDLACGPGWLSFELSKKYPRVTGSDVSEELIKAARKKYPGINFAAADAEKSLPFETEKFDYVILSLAAHDFNNQPAALKNIFSALKPGGKLINLIVNPYYGYPAGVWKRGLLGRLLGKKPELNIAGYHNLPDQFVWNQNLNCHFYPLSLQINNLLGAGFALAYMEDVKAEGKFKNFNLGYKLFRCPIYLLLEARKPGLTNQSSAA